MVPVSCAEPEPLTPYPPPPNPTPHLDACHGSLASLNGDVVVEAPVVVKE